MMSSTFFGDIAFFFAAPRRPLICSAGHAICRLSLLSATLTQLVTSILSHPRVTIGLCVAASGDRSRSGPLPDTSDACLKTKNGHETAQAKKLGTPPAETVPIQATRAGAQERHFRANKSAARVCSMSYREMNMTTPSISLLQRLARCFFLILLMTVVAPRIALAEVSGRISVGTLTFTLTDLDMTDGISPSLVFLPLPYIPPAGQEYSRAWLDNGFLESPGAGQEYTWLYGNGTADLTHAYQINNDLWLTSALTGRGQPGTHLIEVNTFTRAEGKVTRNVHGSIQVGYFPFLLSPNTAVAFEVTVGVDAKVSQNFLREDTFSAGAYIFLVLGENSAEILDQKRYSASPVLRTDIETFAGLDVSDMLSVAGENTSDDYVSGYVSFAGYAGAHSSMAPGIPEPGALPMLTIGLFVAGFWRWRQSNSVA